MKLASNGGVLSGSLQVIHVHVLLVAPLSTGYMSQPVTDQHKGRVAIREVAHHTGASAIPLDDGSFKRDSLELGYLEGDIPGSDGEIAAVMVAVVTLVLLIVLVPSSPGSTFLTLTQPPATYILSRTTSLSAP